MTTKKPIPPVQKRKAKLTKAERFAARPERERPITEKEIEFAHYVMGHDQDGKKRSLEMCAELAGFGSAQAKKLASSTRVKRYCAMYQTEIAREYARHEVDRMVGLDISPLASLCVLARLARTPVHVTRGNIEGQVKACVALLSYGGDAAKMFATRNDQELDFFAKHGYFPEEEPQRKALQ